MYLHIGGDFLIKDENIIGIFDLDTSTVSKITRDFLSNAEKTKKTVYASAELPKSFIISDDKVYISQLSSLTLEKRAEHLKNK